MFKSVVVGSIFLGLMSAAYASNPLPFDRAVIFGDSLSDTGNFPERNDYSSSTFPPYNLYIPISSPVDSNLYNTSFKVPEFNVDWHYPTEQFLAGASSKQGLINGQTKAYRSINWPDYFVYNAFPKASAKLTSWYNTYTASVPPKVTTSLNYAWAGAMTIDGFANQSYTPVKTISEQELYDLKKSYLDGKTSISDVAIPGLRQQVNIYLNDLNNKKVDKTDNTAYLIYIGGNDIANTLSNDLLKFKLKKFFSEVGSVSSPGIISTNVKDAVDNLIKNAGAKHVYVLTYLNVANLPIAYKESSSSIVRWVLKKIISAVVSTYNKQLTNIFNSSSYRSIVKVLPVGKSIDEIAKTPRFSSSVKNGLSCVSHVATATNPKPNINNCNYNNSQTYFAWNNSHLTTTVNQYAAYQVYHDIVNTVSLKKAQSDAKEQFILKSSIKALSLH